MTSLHPPRWAERLLEATGADPELRDAVLGDLMEEFLLRAQYDGERVARRWYVGETLRTLPHLLRYWASGLRGADVKRLAAVALTAYFMVVPFTLLAAILVAGGVDQLLRDVGVPGLALLGIAGAVIGGYVAARVDRRTPLAGALALGCFTCLLSIGASVAGALDRGPVQPPLWWLVCAPFWNLGGAALGGVIRACAFDHERGDGTQRA